MPVGVAQQEECERFPAFRRGTANRQANGVKRDLTRLLKDCLSAFLVNSGVGQGRTRINRAVYLASQGAQVWMLVRRHDLADTMSRYLVDRVRGLSNIEVVTEATVSGVEGKAGMLKAISWRVQPVIARFREGRKFLALASFRSASPSGDQTSIMNCALKSRCAVRAPMQIMYKMSVDLSDVDRRTHRMGAAIARTIVATPCVAARLTNPFRSSARASIRDFAS
jgi:hypothetical protein